MARYIVVENNANFKTFLATQTGAFMFNGDGFFGGGRILNCKKKSDSVQSDYGYFLASSVKILLTPYENEEAAVSSADLTIVDEYENSEDFLTDYTNG